MIEDKWLTIEEARKALLELPHVIWVTEYPMALCGMNDKGCMIFKVRIFTGHEHKLAKAGHVLDWRMDHYTTG